MPASVVSQSRPLYVTDLMYERVNWTLSIRRIRIQKNDVLSCMLIEAMQTFAKKV